LENTFSDQLISVIEVCRLCILLLTECGQQAKAVSKAVSVAGRAWKIIWSGESFIESE
jgi:hypothetical protein